MISVTIFTAACNEQTSQALCASSRPQGSLDKSRRSRVAPKLGEMALAERQRGQGVCLPSPHWRRAGDEVREGPGMRPGDNVA